jgi:hypothetical protein
MLYAEPMGCQRCNANGLVQHAIQLMHMRCCTTCRTTTTLA